MLDRSLRIILPVLLVLTPFVAAGGDGSISSLQPPWKFMSFTSGEPRETEEIEGAWKLTNLQEIKIRNDLETSGIPSFYNWERMLRKLEHSIISVKVVCRRSAMVCLEALAIVNPDDVRSSSAPPRLEAKMNIWNIVEYSSQELLATYYDGCYNNAVTVNLASETAVKVGVAIDGSPCHMGFTNKTVVYELTDG